MYPWLVPRQSREKRFIQKHLENAGVKYVKNFIAKQMSA